MKNTLLLVAFLTVSLFAAEELGLEGDSSSIPSLEESLKEFGADDLIVEEVKPINTPVATTKAKKDSAITTTNNQETSSNKTTLTEPTTDPVTANPSTDSSIQTDVVENVATDVSADTVVTIAMDTSTVTKISSVSSVDIESSLKDYRSPLKALLFSLVVPGAGQAYTKKYWKSGIFVAAEVAAIVGAVHFKKSGDEIQQQAYDHMDSHFDEKRLKTFYTELTEYGRGRWGNDTVVQSYIFMNSHKADSNGTAVENFMSSFQSDRYGNGKQSDAVQGWADASPSFDPNASGTNPFYLVAGTSFATDSAFGHLRLAGSDPFGTSALQGQYISLLKSSEKRYGWSQTMVVALLVNHAVSAMDAFISAHRHNRKMMNEKVEELPKLSFNNGVYRNEIGAVTTSLDLVWKF